MIHFIIAKQDSNGKFTEIFGFGKLFRAENIENALETVDQVNRVKGSGWFGFPVSETSMKKDDGGAD